MSMNLKASFVDYLIQKFPDFQRESIDSIISENLLSPFQVPISKKQIQSIRQEIQHYWKLRNWGATHLATRYQNMDLRQPQNYGVCMSYDFHVNSEQQLELIEINTNASFLALGQQLYSFLKMAEPCTNFQEKDIIEMFRNENRLTGAQDFNLVIVDENPQQQRLYLEFLIYQSLLKNNSLPCEIADINEIEKIKSSSLIYNRYTDFYLQEKKSTQLKGLFNTSKIQLSPNPYEYFLLADKERLIDWSLQTQIEKPQSLLPTYDLGKTDKEKVWSERKSLFFKPKNAFGSKQAYKGSSISRKVFEEVTNSNFIAQKISPAPEITADFNGQPTTYRYDLRCYAYQDQLQLIIARLYQGQTTNLRAEGGGFACVIEIN